MNQKLILSLAVIGMTSCATVQIPPDRLEGSESSIRGARARRPPEAVLAVLQERRCLHAHGAGGRHAAPDARSATGISARARILLVHVVARAEAVEKLQAKGTNR